MNRLSWVFLFNSAVLGLVCLGGCKSTGNNEALQFEPLPVAEVGQADLEPRTRSVGELLLAAKDAFESGNEALEGENPDRESALRNYTRMLELMAESELDPAVFFNLQGEFERILSVSSQHAGVFEAATEPTWSEEATDLSDVTVRSELEYPYPPPRRVLNQIRSIQEDYPERFQAGMERSQLYLPYIRAEFEKAGLPEDLVWLAMVESQYTPKIVSRAGAGGMWQFMRSTGKHYGLRSGDGWVDERYDWKKATHAAIAYLSVLHEMFDGSWPLAVSAYNMGEAGLERAIARNGGETNLWKLIETPPAANRIRRETKNFYPKLLASAIVAKNPERYGIFPETVTPVETEYATIEGAYYLSDLEKEGGLPKDSLVRLNPHLIRRATPPNRSTAIHVPKGTQQIVVAAAVKLPELKPSTHIVQPGETPSEIATMHGVSARELMSLNNIRSARRLQIGQRLAIPGQVDRTASSEFAKSSDGRKVHKVRSGDTLSRIASNARVTVQDLTRWNNLEGGSLIHIGDTLFVSGESTASSVASDRTSSVHVVSAGEFPAKIASKYGMKLSDFLALNDLNSRSTIFVSQKVKVRSTVAKRTPASGPVQKTPQPTGTEVIVHRVAKNESASVIAARYGVRTREFLAWNGLSTRSVIHVGDKLVVYLPKAQAGGGGENLAGGKIVHIVRSGQNPTTIARRYNVKLSDLFKWNNWEGNPVLQVHDQVVIYTK